MKLWDKGYDIDSWIESFTVGNDRQLDMLIARHDVEASMAHIRMLESIGLLTADELARLLEGLQQIAQEIEDGTFQICDGIEDVHSQVEQLLTERLGDVGKKIHSGRSRNDQVLVDLKLFYRAQLKELASETNQLFERLQQLSETYKDVLMPGYTHLQVAMPSSFGLWFGAYAETLVDDLQVVASAYAIANQKNEQRQDGASRRICRQCHSHDTRKNGDGHLPVQQSELCFHPFPRCAYDRVEHHAPQEESRRMGNHARTLQSPAEYRQRNQYDAL